MPGKWSSPRYRAGLIHGAYQAWQPARYRQGFHPDCAYSWLYRQGFAKGFLAAAAARKAGAVSYAVPATTPGAPDGAPGASMPEGHGPKSRAAGEATRAGRMKTGRPRRLEAVPRALRVRACAGCAGRGPVPVGSDTRYTPVVPVPVDVRPAWPGVVACPGRQLVRVAHVERMTDGGSPADAGRRAGTA